MLDAQLTAYLFDWLHMGVRLMHVVTAIAWIGASFYFIWLDLSLEEPPQWKKDKGIKGDLWSVHGGGFYEIAKYKLAPEKLPKTLHWFKWEAYSTWISGMCLLALVYYVGASSYLIDPSKVNLTPWQGIGVGLGSIIIGWLIYEAACRTPLLKHGLLFGLVMLGFVMLDAWILEQLIGDRAAYIHVGAMIGTCMAASVFNTIIPAQKGMVEAVKRGETPDPKPALIAKLRSTHNNYATIPVLLIMISNHFPMTYSHAHAWLILGAIALLGAWARHFFNLKHRGLFKPSILVTALLGFMVVIWLTRPVVPNTADMAAVTDEQAVAIVHQRCSVCHSANPSDNVFTVAPSGIVMDTKEQILRLKDRIMARAITVHDMPFMNKTGMTDEERQRLAQWLQQPHPQ